MLEGKDEHGNSFRHRDIVHYVEGHGRTVLAITDDNRDKLDNALGVDKAFEYVVMENKDFFLGLLQDYYLSVIESEERSILFDTLYQTILIGDDDYYIMYDDFPEDTQVEITQSLSDAFDEVPRCIEILRAEEIRAKDLQFVTLLCSLAYVNYFCRNIFSKAIKRGYFYSTTNIYFI